MTLVPISNEICQYFVAVVFQHPNVFTVKSRGNISNDFSTIWHSYFSNESKNVISRDS